MCGIWCRIVFSCFLVKILSSSASQTSGVNFDGRLRSSFPARFWCRNLCSILLDRTPEKCVSHTSEVIYLGGDNYYPAIPGAPFVRPRNRSKCATKNRPGPFYGEEYVGDRYVVGGYGEKNVRLGQKLSFQICKKNFSSKTQWKIRDTNNVRRINGSNRSLRKGKFWSSSCRENLFRLNGVPRLFRWVADLFPSAQQNIHKHTASRFVDNLYLDLNGVFHMCSHNNNNEGVCEEDNEVIFNNIFLYIHKLFTTIKPRKLLFLAIDGVAPRAKINQQRNRRFRSAKLHQENFPLQNTQAFDGNSITPGTEFMHTLNLALRKWIEFKLKTDPLYKIPIILSGPEVPGEGEHKILQYIRDGCGVLERGEKNEGKKILEKNEKKISEKNEKKKLEKNEEKKKMEKKNNISHCLYGMDGDLIFLSLISHEKDFVLLREKLSVVHPRKKSFFDLVGGTYVSNKKHPLDYTKDDFEILDISVLRETISTQFAHLRQELTFEWSVEKIIDDLVFLAFFVGNDFIPHLPHLSIADGAMTDIVRIYYSLLPKLQGYITDKVRIHPGRLQIMLRALSLSESGFFGSKMSASSQSFGEGGGETNSHKTSKNTKNDPNKLNQSKNDEKNYKNDEKNEEKNDKNEGPNDKNEEKNELNEKSGYKKKYYETKFGVGTEEGIKEVVLKYMEGLYWVLHYYQKGCISWAWHYPYHYGPLASDVYKYTNMQVVLQPGAPFPPLLQLLSVMPPQCSRLLPAPYRDLVSREDSPVRSFYPESFEVDPNGKLHEWEHIIKIPFIDEHKLKRAIQTHVTSPLSPQEAFRNIPGRTHFYLPLNNHK